MPWLGAVAGWDTDGLAGLDAVAVGSVDRGNVALTGLEAGGSVNAKKLNSATRLEVSCVSKAQALRPRGSKSFFRGFCIDCTCARFSMNYAMVKP